MKFLVDINEETRTVKVQEVKAGDNETLYLSEYKSKGGYIGLLDEGLDVLFNRAADELPAPSQSQTILDASL